MSSRKLLLLIEGLPDASWFKLQLRMDMREALGELNVAQQQQVKDATEALLRGERKPRGPVVLEKVEGERRVRRKRADQA